MSTSSTRLLNKSMRSCMVSSVAPSIRIIDFNSSSVMGFHPGMCCVMYSSALQNVGGRSCCCWAEDGGLALGGRADDEEGAKDCSHGIRPGLYTQSKWEHSQMTSRAD